jgi:hypothetical protein
MASSPRLCPHPRRWRRTRPHRCGRSRLKSEEDVARAEFGFADRDGADLLIQRRIEGRIARHSCGRSRGGRGTVLTVQAVQEAQHGVGSLGGEQRLGRLHCRAGSARAVRGKAALVAQRADALDGGAEAGEGLFEAAAGLGGAARGRGQEGHAAALHLIE